MLVLLLGCTPAISFDNVTFTVELAQTPSEHAQGLMYRESMPSNHGMLFIFDSLEPRGFWMQNTKIALDMIFFDDKWTVVEVKSNIQPCVSDPCEVYLSVPAQYVLEINAGQAEQYNIKSGVKAQLRE